MKIQPNSDLDAAISGALKCSIDAHGSISKSKIGSATKRIVGAVMSLVDPETTPEEQQDRDECMENERRAEAVYNAAVGSPALAKACRDPFDYAMRLRTGEVLYFTEASIIDREWVHLNLKPMDEQPNENRIAYPAERGVDVRISDIVWVMDAPNGS